MEIEKIVSSVQSKVGNTDFSAQTIQKAVELYPLADGQEPDEAYFSKVANFLQGMQGQYNHDFSTKFSEAKKNLLTEKTFKDMSADQVAQVKSWLGIAPSGAPTPPAGDSETVKQLKAELATLKNRLDDGDKAKRQAELLQKVKAAMKEQKASDDYVLENTLKGAVMDENKSVDDLTKEYLVKYDAEYLKCRGGGTPPRQSSQNNGKGESAADRFFAKKAKKEGWKK